MEVYLQVLNEDLLHGSTSVNPTSSILPNHRRNFTGADVSQLPCVKLPSFQHTELLRKSTKLMSKDFLMFLSISH